MKALITGIDGFVGSHLAEHLLARGDEVAGTFHFDPQLKLLGENGARIDARKLDLRDRDEVRRVIEKTNPDRIYHLAAMAFVPTSFKDPRLTFDVNLMGTMTLCETVSQVQIDPLVLFVSTAEVFGIVAPDELPLDERSPARPNSPYSISKLSAEMMTRFYAQRKGVRAVIVRPFNHTGARQSSQFVCSDFARQIAEIEKGLKPPVMSVGNLDAKRDFSDVRDIVRAYALALDSCPPDGDVYVLGSGRAVAIREVLDKLLAMSRAAIEITQDPAKMRPSDLPEIRGDSTKFRKLTDWRPEYDLDATLRSVLDYWRAQVGN